MSVYEFTRSWLYRARVTAVDLAGALDQLEAQDALTLPLWQPCGPLDDTELVRVDGVPPEEGVQVAWRDWIREGEGRTPGVAEWLAAVDPAQTQPVAATPAPAIGVQEAWPERPEAEARPERAVEPDDQLVQRAIGAFEMWCVDHAFDADGEELAERMHWIADWYGGSESAPVAVLVERLRLKWDGDLRSVYWGH